MARPPGEYLGQTLRSLRERYKLSQRDLARRVGVRSQYICRIEKNQDRVTREQYNKIVLAIISDAVICASCGQVVLTRRKRHARSKNYDGQSEETS